MPNRKVIKGGIAGFGIGASIGVGIVGWLKPSTAEVQAARLEWEDTGSKLDGLLISRPCAAAVVGSQVEIRMHHPDGSATASRKLPEVIHEACPEEALPDAMPDIAATYDQRVATFAALSELEDRRSPLTAVKVGLMGGAFGVVVGGTTADMLADRKKYLGF